MTGGDAGLPDTDSPTPERPLFIYLGVNIYLDLTRSLPPAFKWPKQSAKSGGRGFGWRWSVLPPGASPPQSISHPEHLHPISSPIQSISILEHPHPIASPSQSIPNPEHPHPRASPIRNISHPTARHWDNPSGCPTPSPFPLEFCRKVGQLRRCYLSAFPLNPCRSGRKPGPGAFPPPSLPLPEAICGFATNVRNFHLQEGVKLGSFVPSEGNCSLRRMQTNKQMQINP